MKHFSSFIAEAETNIKPIKDTLRTAFGRHQGMHAGHADSLKYGLTEQGGNDVDKRLYTSRTQDPKKNPLSREFKERHLQSAIPETKGMWDSDPRVKTPIDVMNKAYEEDGYKNFQAVVGPDRVESFEKLLRSQNPGFKNVDVITDPTMIRDPDLLKAKEGEGNMSPGDLRKRLIASLSGSGQRKLAGGGNFEKFREGMDFGDHYGDDMKKEYFEELRRSMGSDRNPQVRNIDSEWQMDLDTEKEYLGELYRTGNLFQVGDMIEHSPTNLIAKIHRCGANHLICVTEEGYMFKSFIHDANQI